MTALSLIITRAGLARHAAAQLDGSLSLEIAKVGFTDAVFVQAPTLTALPGEHRRLDTVSGAVVGDDTVHLTIRDDVGTGYGVRGFGLFLADGTLFAVYGQSDRIVEKSAQVALFLALDVAFPIGNVETLSFGNTSFLLPGATTTTKGLVELATQAEADAGTAGPLVVTAALLARAVAATRAYVDMAIAATVASVGQALDGLAARTVYGTGLVSGGGRNDTNRTLTVDAATGEDVIAGIASNCAVTPAALKAAGIVYLAEQKNDGPSRYRRWSDGLVEMSGVSALPGTESAFTLNFPWAFPTECEGIWSTVINSAQTNDGQSTVQEVALTAASATLYAQNHKTPTADASGGFRWFARGY